MGVTINRGMTSRGLRVPLPPGVLAIAAVAVAALLLLANEYGFHRDELYFVVAGQHPDWGYDDQPPLTPVLSAAGVALLGATPLAVRVLPALVMGVSIMLAAAMARDMGGGRGAQTVAAISVAVSGLLLAGHVASTSTYELLAWGVAGFLVVRILGGADPRLWLLVGVTVGLGLLNKYTVALLPATLAVGLVVERRWEVIRSPWPWAAAAIAFAIWAPNLLWQAAHDWPQLDMARHIAAATADENRVQLIPLQLVFAGPLLWPVVVVGIWRLVRARDARPWRAFAWAYLVALAVTLWQGGKAYYTIGFLPVLFAAGSIGVAAWLGRGRRRLRLATFGVAAAVSGALIAVLVLPILPPATLVSSGVHDINKESGEQIGWPELAAAVDAVVEGLAPEDREHAVIVTANYGQAGAIELLGHDLAPVYSGHNSYWYWGPPADDTRVAIVVGRSRFPGLGDCRSAARVDNGAGIENEEQGTVIGVCRAMPASWPAAWRGYHHLD